MVQTIPALVEILLELLANTNVVFAGSSHQWPLAEPSSETLPGRLMLKEFPSSLLVVWRCLKTSKDNSSVRVSSTQPLIWTRSFFAVFSRNHANKMSRYVKSTPRSVDLISYLKAKPLSNRAEIESSTFPNILGAGQCRRLAIQGHEFTCLVPKITRSTTRMLQHGVATDG